MSTFIQAIVNGFMVGGIYALVGVSLTLIFGVLKIVNFCQGQLLMLGMYVSYTLYAQFHIDPFFGIPLTAAIMFLFGMIIQGVFITRSMQDDQDSNILFLTVGLGILFENVCLMIFKSDYRTANSVFSNKVLNLGNFNASVPKLIGLAIVVVVAILLGAFLKYTRIGKEIRATSQNRTGAEVCGIKTKFVYAATYGIGAAILGVAASCLMLYYYVFPAVGDVYGTRAFIVVTLGGLGNVIGALVGGIVLGLLETVGSVIVGSSFKDTLVFAVFILILVGKQMFKGKRG